LMVENDQRDPPWGMMAILGACPNLRRFYCYRLDADDLVKAEQMRQGSVPEGQISADAGVSTVETAMKLQWVCKHMEEFSVMALEWSVDKYQNRQMHEELKALKNLKSLLVGTKDRPRSLAEIQAKAFGYDEYDDSDEEEEEEREEKEEEEEEEEDEEEQNLVQDPTRLWIHGIYDRSQLEQRPRMRWMARTWPKLQFYSNGCYREMEDGIFD